MNDAAFPGQTGNELQASLEGREGTRIRSLVDNAIRRDGEAPHDKLIASAKIDLIELGEQWALPDTWTRPSDKSRYEQYGIKIVSGADLVRAGSAGGPFLDRDFVLVDDSGNFRIRAANDEHRDELAEKVRAHVEKANEVLTTWNEALPELIASEIAQAERQQKQDRGRTDQKTKDGWPPRVQRHSRDW